MPNPIEYSKLTNELSYVIYNVGARLTYILRYPWLRRHLVCNTRFKDKHKGERCFIVGNGPSLLKQDLSYLENETVFCVNYMYKSDLIDVLKPTYYCVVDSSVLKSDDFLPDLLSKTDCDAYFFSWRFLSYLTNPQVDNIDKQRMHFAYAKHMPSRWSVRTNMHTFASAFINVICSTIMTALYMGFAEIYLLGCDFNQFIYDKHAYNPQGTVLAYPIANTLRGHAIAAEQHEYLFKLSKKLETDIFNATPESSLNVYPFVEYQKIFK